jgi:hypothetical protein
VMLGGATTELSEHGQVLRSSSTLRLRFYRISTAKPSP